MQFFFASCATVEIARSPFSEIKVTAFCVRSGSSLQAEEYLAFRLPACPRELCCARLHRGQGFLGILLRQERFQVRVQLLCHKI